jgi:hypothetical protein
MPSSGMWNREALIRTDRCMRRLLVTANVFPSSDIEECTIIIIVMLKKHGMRPEDGRKTELVVRINYYN